MEKEIDINNEEQILEECNFDFFYDCELCSFELCMFYNDILCKTNNVHSDLNTRSALIYLGRIAITFNKLVEILKELKEEYQKLKQSQNKKAIEVLEDIRKTIRYSIMICGGKATDFDIVAANAYNRCLDDMQKIIDNQIKNLKEGK